MDPHVMRLNMLQFNNTRNHQWNSLFVAMETGDTPLTRGVDHETSTRLGHWMQEYYHDYSALCFSAIQRPRRKILLFASTNEAKFTQRSMRQPLSQVLFLTGSQLIVCSAKRRRTRRNHRCRIRVHRPASRFPKLYPYWILALKTPE